MKFKDINLNSEKDLFKHIIQEYPKTWQKIYEELCEVKIEEPIFKGLYPTSLIYGGVLRWFENRGVDFGYIDIEGKDFLQYCYHCQGHRPPKAIWYFNNLILDDIGHKISNSYNYNKPIMNGQTIVFDMVGFHIADYQFFDFLEAHNNIKLDIIDLEGRNLLGNSILNMASDDIIRFLMKKNDIYHRDKNGDNLLVLFWEKYFLDYNKRIFQDLLLKLDISQTNYQDKSPLDKLFEDFMKLNNEQVKSIHDESKESKKKLTIINYINLVCKAIINEEFFHTHDSIKSIMTTFEKNKQDYLDILAKSYHEDYYLSKKEIKENIEKSEQKLKVLSLETLLPMQSQSKKIKI